MAFRSLLAVAITFLSGCSERAPVAEAQANLYQRAVYFNAQRPKADFQRDSYRKPANILEFSGAQAGDKVIDLLGGGGWYTELLSSVVGDEGQVFLVNSPLFVNFTKNDIAARLQHDRLKNVTRIDGPWNDLGMPEQVDGIFLVLAFHDIYVKRPEKPEFEADPESFFRQLQRALKPNGYLLIIDHASEAGVGNAQAGSLHRIEESFARKELEARGFRFVKSLDILRNPNDDFSKDIWDKGVMHKTDRFVHLYLKSE